MHIFTQTELSQITAAVQQAELQTSGEIVPVIYEAAFPRRLYRFVPQKFIAAYTRYTARTEFYHLGIHKTQGRTGIVIVVFLQERRVEVVADKGISAHYTQNTWNELVTLITTAAKQEQLIAGFCKAIIRCGEILGAHCPRQVDDINELPDTVKIIYR